MYPRHLQHMEKLLRMRTGVFCLSDACLDGSFLLSDGRCHHQGFLSGSGGSKTSI
jgi:hypothetical protein